MATVVPHKAMATTMTPNKAGHIEGLVQQELAQMFSSDFSEVSRSDLTPFLVLMRLVRREYARQRPEVYRTIIALLHDYDPQLGQAHRDKTVRYLRTLLGGDQELADQLTSVLPPATVKVGPETPPGSTDRPPDSQQAPEASIDPEAPQPSVKFYNYTPVVTAYMASQGVTPKVVPIQTSAGNLILNPVTLTKGTHPFVNLSRGVNPTIVTPGAASAILQPFGHARILLKQEFEKRVAEDSKVSLSVTELTGKGSQGTPVESAQETRKSAEESIEVSKDAQEPSTQGKDKAENIYNAEIQKENQDGEDTQASDPQSSTLNVVLPASATSDSSTPTSTEGGLQDKYLKVQIRKSRKRRNPFTDQPSEAKTLVLQSIGNGQTTEHSKNEASKNTNSLHTELMRKLASLPSLQIKPAALYPPTKSVTAAPSRNKIHVLPKNSMFRRVAPVSSLPTIISSSASSIDEPLDLSVRSSRSCTEPVGQPNEPVRDENTDSPKTHKEHSVSIRYGPIMGSQTKTESIKFSPAGKSVASRTYPSIEPLVVRGVSSSEPFIVRSVSSAKTLVVRAAQSSEPLVVRSVPSSEHTVARSAPSSEQMVARSAQSNEQMVARSAPSSEQMVARSAPSSEQMVVRSAQSNAPLIMRGSHSEPLTVRSVPCCEPLIEKGVPSIESLIVRAGQPSNDQLVSSRAAVSSKTHLAPSVPGTTSAAVTSMTWRPVQDCDENDCSGYKVDSATIMKINKEMSRDAYQTPESSQLIARNIHDSSRFIAHNIQNSTRSSAVEAHRPLMAPQPYIRPEPVYGTAGTRNIHLNPEPREDLVFTPPTQESHQYLYPRMPTFNSEKHVNYLSRLIKTPPPPDYSDLWGLGNETKPRKPPTNNGRPKSRRKPRK